MAKSLPSLFPIHGTFSDFTFVRSGKYGNHVRRARGTVTPVEVNDTLQKNADRAKKVTSTARPLLQCFKEMGKNFVQHGLWQIMLKRMFKVKSTSVPDLLRSLDGLEMNEDYKIEKITGLLPPAKISVKNNKLNVQLAPMRRAIFSNKEKLDSYRYELFVTWVDGKGSRFEGDSTNTKWIDLEEEVEKLNFNFSTEKWAKYGLLVLKVEGGVNEKVQGNRVGIGMKVVGVVG